MEQYIEIFTLVTGLVYLALEISQKNAMWIVGTVTSAAAVYMFAANGLYASMALNIALECACNRGLDCPACLGPAKDWGWNAFARRVHSHSECRGDILAEQVVFPAVVYPDFREHTLCLPVLFPGPVLDDGPIRLLYGIFRLRRHLLAPPRGVCRLTDGISVRF